MSDQMRDGAPGSRRIDPELLAAFLDGKLGPEERTRVIAALGASRDLIRTYADAVGATRELEADPRLPVVPIPARPRGTPRWMLATLSVAALLLVTVGMLLLRRPVTTPALGAAESIVASARTEAGRDLALPARPWHVLRGNGDIVSSRGRGVRIGAMIADLELTTAAGNADVAIALRIAALLDSVPGGFIGGRVYADLAMRDASSLSRAALRAASGTAELVVNRRELRVGVWLETARVAMGRQDSTFLASTTTRSAITDLQYLTRTSADDRTTVARLSAALETRPMNLAAVGESATELLRALGS
jgi:hypothetical protein